MDSGRLVIVTTSLDIRRGGVEKFCLDLKSALEGSYEVFVVAPKPEVHAPGILGKLGFDNIARTISMRQEIIELSPDLVITNRDFGILFLKTPKIHVFHGAIVAQKWSERHGLKLRDWFLRGALAGGLVEYLSALRAVSRVAVSRSTAEEVERIYRLKVNEIIPNGVEIPHILPSNKRANDLLFASRREPRKGYEDAVVIANKLQLNLRVAASGEDTRTINLGLLDSRQLQEQYETVRGVILPSRHEACSYTILEALASSCPVFTTKVGWILELVEMVPAYEALVVNPQSPQALADKIRILMNDPQRLDDIMSKVNDTIRKTVSLETFKQRWETHVQQVLNARIPLG